MASPMGHSWGNRPAIKARNLLKYPTSEIRRILKGEFPLEFDDGEIVNVTASEVIFSSYFWVFFRDKKNPLQLTSKYLARKYIGNDVTMSTHLEYLRDVYWDAMDAMNIPLGYARSRYLEVMYMTINRLIVEYSEHNKFQRLLDAFHMTEVVKNPVIENIKKQLREGEIDIATANATIIKTMRTNEVLRDNVFSKTVRNGLANNTQLAQCFGVRGQVTEVDDYIIPRPVLSGFAEGLKNMFEYFAESRTAAGALMYAENPLQDSEYLARRLHFLVMTVLGVKDRDCGSKDYIDFYVRGVEKENGRVTYQGDLENIEGSYMLDGMKGLRAVTAKDTDLIGTTIKLRNAIYCKDLDKYSICRVCFGDMALNLNPDFNLGHYSTTQVTELITQSILSRKHVAESSVSKKIYLSETANLFFQIGGKGSSIMLKPTRKHIVLRVPQKEAHGLQNAINTKDFDKLSISRLSSIGSCKVIVKGLASDLETTVSLEVGGRKVLMSKPLIEYVRDNGLHATNSGDFVIDLKDWDVKTPMFIAPDMEYSFVQHAKNVSSIIESRMEELAERAEPESPEATLLELYSLVNSKQAVNISLLGVIIYASMVADPVKGNYDLPRNAKKPGLSVSTLTVQKRSLGPLYPYEEQTKAGFCSPDSYFSENKPKSPFDVLYMPEEVVNEYLREEGITDRNEVEKPPLFNEREKFIGFKFW